MLLILYSYLIWSLLGTSVAVQADVASQAASTKSPYRNLAPSNADFAFSLFKKLTTSNSDKDILISPLVTSMVLSMLSLGASGHTRVQMLKGLGFDLNEVPETEIHQSFQRLYELIRLSEMSLGSALFHNQSLNLTELFSADTKRYYGLENLSVNFPDWSRSRKQIHEYIKDKTQGEISDSIMELESPATMVLINYVSFTGTWKQAFDPQNTRLSDFYVNDTTVVKVPMMYQAGDFPHLHDTELGCVVVKLEYVGNNTAFFVIPDKNKMDTVIQALSRDTVHRWATSMTTSRLDLYIPKLSLSGTYDLGAIMKDLGIADLQNNRTDLSRITGNAQQWLSRVIHKPKLRLSEKGKEAAPTPASASRGRRETDEPRTIQVNRPFLIMVFDDVSWSSLFLGKVVRPP